jgi:hypothetical protein
LDVLQSIKGSDQPSCVLRVLAEHCGVLAGGIRVLARWNHHFSLQLLLKEFKGAPALDAGLLAAAQAVEHYEIARYGTLKTWAAELGLNQSVKLLETTLSEEKKTDETLTKLAESEVNQHAQAA